MSITSEQCRAARAMIGWSQEKLAREAGVARATVADFERGTRQPILNNLLSIKSSLENNGIEFLFDSKGNGQGIKLIG